MTDREKDAALVAEFRERAETDKPTVEVFRCVAEAVVRELDRLQRLVEGLSARVAAQSELLGKRAERRET